MAEIQERPVSIRLSEICWPVFQFVTHFVRQLKHGATPDPNQVRFEALAALRDAEDASREDPVTDRAWNDRVKAMMIYFVDYKMLNSGWEGHGFWFENRLETSPDGLNEPEPLGGDRFFEQCDEVLRECEVAERRERKDRDELAGLLNLYYICLRLGFKGGYHDRPIELADYSKRLFSHLPAQATTRGREMFPEAYKANQELKIDYRLGMKLTVVLVIFFAVIATAVAAFRFAWSDAVGQIDRIAQQWSKGLPERVQADGQAAAPSGPASGGVK